MRPEALLIPRPEGLYCPPGDFYIDPIRPVARALVTHAHSDHARAGHEAVLATPTTLDLMALRLGVGFCGTRQAVRYRERIRHHGVDVTFHPAGHVLGSAQIALEWGGMRIVISGDFKPRPDPTADPFELVSCDIFITEATFGLPVFRHPPVEGEVAKLLEAIARSPDQPHLVGAYSLGKAQRLMRLARLAGYDAPIGIHPALLKVSAYYQSSGIDLGRLVPLSADRKGTEPPPALVIAPPAALHERWSERLGPCVRVGASGFMRITARARASRVELALVISDHADWPELQAVLPATGASEIWVTHGQEDALVHWCATQGLAARPLRLVGYDEDAA